MSDLTEKWKSGGLEKNKKYYTTDKLGRSYIKTYNKKGFKGLVHEVLAPVPSYETYLTMKDCAKMVFEAAERETKLKELLKKCRDLMNRAGYVFAKIEDVEKARNLLTKIDEVLK